MYCIVMKCNAALILMSLILILKIRMMMLEFVMYYCWLSSCWSPIATILNHPWNPGEGKLQDSSRSLLAFLKVIVVSRSLSWIGLIVSFLQRLSLSREPTQTLQGWPTWPFSGELETSSALWYFLMSTVIICTFFVNRCNGGGLVNGTIKVASHKL